MPGLLFVHENNIRNKISENYHGKRAELQQFYNNTYLPMRESLLNITFSPDNEDAFNRAAEIINHYFNDLWRASELYNINAQSKFESTYYEEISCYLFHNLPQIENETYSIFNKGIYAGLKIDTNNHISIIKKDVDFCIGRKTTVEFDNERPISLILPIITVEVKTYLDATMFGEVKSSSKAIRSASPFSRAYILMGYKDLADEHIIAARQDSTLTEIFALRRDKEAEINASVLQEYYKEIKNAIETATETTPVQTPGRLLFPQNALHPD